MPEDKLLDWLNERLSEGKINKQEFDDYLLKKNKKESTLSGKKFSSLTAAQKDKMIEIALIRIGVLTKDGYVIWKFHIKLF